VKPHGPSPRTEKIDSTGELIPHCKWQNTLLTCAYYFSDGTELSATGPSLSNMHGLTNPKDPPQPDQTLLVLLAQTGDRDALEQLLRESHAPLRRYISRLAGPDLVDDILQETSIQIFRKLPFLREPAVFRAWTLRIASRIAFSHLKRAHRWLPLDGAPLEPLVPDPTLGEPPDANFLSLVDHVSPASRAVLLLHYQHDLSLEETAAILDIPVGTAKSRLHYGVASIRKHLISERKPA
jgi:RNA polymerase sigma-70 factor, ECF subfamily